MRLAQIHTDAHRHRQFNRLFGDGIPYHPDDILSYLFIESVIASGVLTEASHNRLMALFNAGIARLKRLFTSRARNDLLSMLTLINPKVRIDDVNDLINQALAAKGDIVSDRDWWTRVFGVFGISNPRVQEAIIATVSQTVRGQQQPHGADQPQSDEGKTAEAAQHGHDSDQPQSDEGRTAEAAQHGHDSDQPRSDEGRTAEAAQHGHDTTAASKDRWLDAMTTISRQREAAAASRDRLLKVIDDIRRQRQEAIARLRELRAKGAHRLHDTDVSPDEVVEHILADIAARLLNEDCVHKNLHSVASHMIRRMGQPHAIILDENWLSHLTRTIASGARSPMSGSITRPRYAGLRRAGADDVRMGAVSAGSGRTSSRSTNANRLAASLAIRLLADHLRAQLDDKLDKVGLTLPDAIRTINIWNELYTRYKRGDRTPQTREALRQNLKKLKQILLAIYPQLARAFGGDPAAWSRYVTNRFKATP